MYILVYFGVPSIFGPSNDDNSTLQIFDSTPASKEGTLQSGDELVGVNGQTVKGKTKVEVAKMIQTAKVTDGLSIMN